MKKRNASLEVIQITKKQDTLSSETDISLVVEDEEDSDECKESYKLSYIEK